MTSNNNDLEEIFKLISHPNSTCETCTLHYKKRTKFYVYHLRKCDDYHVSLTAKITIVSLTWLLTRTSFSSRLKSSKRPWHRAISENKTKNEDCRKHILRVLSGKRLKYKKDIIRPFEAISTVIFSSEQWTLFGIHLSTFADLLLSKCYKENVSFFLVKGVSFISYR